MKACHRGERRANRPEASGRSIVESLSQTFADRAGIELHRAERYRVFVALTMIDLGFLKEKLAGAALDETINQMTAFVRKQIRACDYVARLDDECLGLLLPETSRQGAEVALRRITESMREELGQITGQPVKQIIPAGLASYPDAAGAVTVSQFLQDLQHHCRN